MNEVAIGDVVDLSDRDDSCSCFLLSQWLYIQLFPSEAAEAISSGGDLGKVVGDFFKRINGDGGQAFLETQQGLPYVELFRKLRLAYILNDSRNIAYVVVGNDK